MQLHTCVQWVMWLCIFTQKEVVLNNLVPSLGLFHATQLNVHEEVTTTPELAIEEPALVGYRHQIFMALHLVYEVKNMWKNTMHTRYIASSGWYTCIGAETVHHRS